MSKLISKEEYNLKMKLYYRKNPKKQSAYRQRETLISSLGGKCVKCGFDDIRALQIDHINGGGEQQQKIFGGKYYVYKYYNEHPELADKEVQILCANCNWIKRQEEKELHKYK